MCSIIIELWHCLLQFIIAITVDCVTTYSHIFRHTLHDAPSGAIHELLLNHDTSGIASEFILITVDVMQCVLWFTRVISARKSTFLSRIPL